MKSAIEMDETELLRAAASLAMGVAVALAEAQANRDRRSAIPSLVGPALEQVLAVVDALRGTAAACVTRETISIVDSLEATFRSVSLDTMAHKDGQSHVRDDLAALAINAAASTVDAPILSSAGEA